MERAKLRMALRWTLPRRHSRKGGIAGTPSAADLPQGNAAKFAALLGHAALKTWAELPRDAQERLFAAAVDDGVIANDLAEYLHDHQPRTAHPPKPTRLA